jgi:hypothetical protein
MTMVFPSGEGATERIVFSSNAVSCCWRPPPTDMRQRLNCPDVFVTNRIRRPSGENASAG